jgi:hypothetical protein
MDWQAWVKAAWESAQQLGLTSRWEFWVAIVALLVLLILAKRLGPPGWLWLHSLKPAPDLTDHPPSPPIPTQGGTPTSSGSIPQPGPSGPQPGQGAP